LTKPVIFDRAGPSQPESPGREVLEGRRGPGAWASPRGSGARARFERQTGRCWLVGQFREWTGSRGWEMPTIDGEKAAVVQCIFKFRPPSRDLAAWRGRGGQSQRAGEATTASLHRTSVQVTDVAASLHIVQGSHSLATLYSGPGSLPPLDYWDRRPGTPLPLPIPSWGSAAKFETAGDHRTSQARRAA
jgi:hypothetical protein